MYVTGPGPSEAHMLDVSLLIPRFEVLRQVIQSFDLDQNDPDLESRGSGNPSFLFCPEI